MRQSNNEVSPFSHLFQNYVPIRMLNLSEPNRFHQFEKGPERFELTESELLKRKTWTIEPPPYRAEQSIFRKRQRETQTCADAKNTHVLFGPIHTWSVHCPPPSSHVEENCIRFKSPVEEKSDQQPHSAIPEHLFLSFDLLRVIRQPFPPLRFRHAIRLASSSRYCRMEWTIALTRSFIALYTCEELNSNPLAYGEEVAQFIRMYKTSQLQRTRWDSPSLQFLHLLLFSPLAEHPLQNKFVKAFLKCNRIIEAVLFSNHSGLSNSLVWKSKALLDFTESTLRTVRSRVYSEVMASTCHGLSDSTHTCDTPSTGPSSVLLRCLSQSEIEQLQFLIEMAHSSKLAPLNSELSLFELNLFLKKFTKWSTPNCSKRALDFLCLERIFVKVELSDISHTKVLQTFLKKELEFFRSEWIGFGITCLEHWLDGMEEDPSRNLEEIHSLSIALLRKGLVHFAQEGQTAPLCLALLRIRNQIENRKHTQPHWSVLSNTLDGFSPCLQHPFLIISAVSLSQCSFLLLQLCSIQINFPLAIRMAAIGKVMGVSPMRELQKNVMNALRSGECGLERIPMRLVWAIGSGVESLYALFSKEQTRSLQNFKEAKRRLKRCAKRYLKEDTRPMERIMHFLKETCTESETDQTDLLVQFANGKLHYLLILSPKALAHVSHYPEHLRIIQRQMEQYQHDGQSAEIWCPFDAFLFENKTATLTEELLTQFGSTWFKLMPLNATLQLCVGEHRKHSALAIALSALKAKVSARVLLLTDGEEMNDTGDVVVMEISELIKRIKQ